MAEGIVLVTGGRGFIGRHVARELAHRGREVVGLGHGTWDHDDARRWGIARWHEGDVVLPALRDLGRHFDAIIHCAGSATVAASAVDPHACFERTVASTAAVLEAARLSRSTKVVILSSAAVYGRSSDNHIRESAVVAPISTYGFHKSLAENIAVEYGRTFHVPVAVLRFFSVYGPGLRKQLLWDACRKLARGEPRFSGTGEETRDWVHVEDAAALVAIAVERASEKCPIVNGGTGTAVRVADVLMILATALGSSAEPSFDGRIRRGDPAHLVADPARAISWGWTTRWTVSEGLKSYAEWYHGETG